mmetsp:Transcript_36237/g.88128  ORF Transcript_36237/g.88128 Transcript_36237/m.88128 type:complete len:213 (-) Transcript_36237:293-931(-)
MSNEWRMGFALTLRASSSSRSCLSSFAANSFSFSDPLASLLSTKGAGSVRRDLSCLGTKVREKSGMGFALKLEVEALRSSSDAHGVTLRDLTMVRSWGEVGMVSFRDWRGLEAADDADGALVAAGAGRALNSNEASPPPRLSREDSRERERRCSDRSCERRRGPVGLVSCFLSTLGTPRSPHDSSTFALRGRARNWLFFISWKAASSLSAAL